MIQPCPPRARALARVFPVRRRRMAAAGLALALAAGLAAAVPAESLRLARAMPESVNEPRWDPSDLVPPSRQTAHPAEPLAVASAMYAHWTAQLSMALGAAESPRAWKQFMGLGPNLFEATKRLGLQQWEEGELWEAAVLLEQAHALDDRDMEVASKLGYALKETGRYERALDLLFLASVEDSVNYLVWLWLGDVQRLLGDYDGALESMQMARDLAPPGQVDELEAFVGYSRILAEKSPSWENFETHRDFAGRHQFTGRIRGLIAEYFNALDVAPETGLTPEDAFERKAWTYAEIGVQHAFLKEHDVALEYYDRAVALYGEARNDLDAARNLNNMADAFYFLAEREGADREALLDQSLEMRQRALDRVRRANEPEYMRYIQGRLLGSLLARYSATDSRVLEVRARNLRELPRSPIIDDYAIAAVADGEAAFRLADGDIAGARVLLENVLEYYEASEFLEDSERAAAHLATLAHIYTEQEHYGVALQLAEKAAETISGIRRVMNPDTFSRSGTVALMRQVAAALVRLHLLLDDPEAALDVSEQYHLQTRVDLLGSRVVGDPAYTEYATEKRLLQRRLPEFREAHETALETGDAERAERLAARIALDEQRLEWLERGVEFVTAAQLDFRPIAPRSSEDLLAAIPGNAVYVAYHVDRHGAVALIAEDGAVRGVFLPEAGEVGLREAVNELWDALGGVADEADEADADAVLTGLHARYVAPLGAIEAEVVYVAADDLLAAVPFHALHASGEAPLGLAHVVAAAPALSAVIERPRRAGSPAPGLRFITPEAIEAPPERLAGASPELFAGAEATPAAIFAPNLPAALHIAAPIELQPAAPALNALLLHDGAPLYAASILPRRLDARQAALELVFPEDAALGGGRKLLPLVDAFRYAGARAVMLNAWNPAPEAAELFVRAFYAALEDAPDPGQAYRAALEAARKAHPDPRDWAAFQLHGAAD